MPKTPIDPDDIRKGDLIRFEYDDPRDSPPFTACEVRIERDGQRVTREAGQHYLLDRPKPAVDLPTEPTLGWLVTYEGEESSGLGIHRTHFNIFEPVEGGITDSAAAGMWPEDCIVSFTPAAAVPTEALNRVRRQIRTDEFDHANGWDAAIRLRGLIDSLLDAIDEANA